MKYITYVSDVTHELDVVTPNFNNISDLFKHLILPDYNTELIIISHQTIKQSGISIYDILSTIKSLCSKQIKPQIAISADISISPTDLKELIGLDILGIYPVGLGFSKIESQLSLDQLLSGKRHIHQKFKTLLLYTKKKSLTKETPHLTNREQQIVNLIKFTGDCNKTIARKLFISENTVKLHMSHILKKLGIKSRTQLAIQQ